MRVHWDALIPGTVTGLVGAGVLAVLVSARNRIRNELLKRRIRKTLDRVGVGSGIQGITMSVHNETGREMVVRQIAFLMGGTYIVLLPSGELTSAYRGESRKPTRAEMRRLRKGEVIQMEAQMQFGSWKVPPVPAGFVALPPYTKSSFILPAEFIGGSDHPIKGIRIVLEYVTRSGDKKILQRDVRSKHPEQMKKTLDHFRDELRSGSFNKARRMFGMAEIAAMPTSANDTSPESAGDAPLPTA